MRLYFSLIATLMLAACASTDTQLIKKVDPYTNERQFALGPIKTTNCPDSNRVDGWVDIKFIGTGDLNTFNVNYEGSRWLFLNPQIPLDIIIDGVSIKLKAIQRPSRKVISGGHVTESLYYPIDKNFGKMFSSANSVRFRVLGENGSIEQCITKDSLQKTKDITNLLQ